MNYMTVLDLVDAAGIVQQSTIVSWKKSGVGFEVVTFLSLTTG
jgi:hypothetical protein